MGNGASVKKVNTRNEGEVVAVKEAFLNRSLSFGEIETPRFSSKKLKEEVDNGGASGSCHSNLECEVKKLKDQVGWLETVKLDLDDKVENLTAQVENLKSNNFSLSGENAQLQIKVQKLELELEKSKDTLASSQQQYEELKNEAKLKIKASQRKLAEFKQSTSLQIFELKQENEDLKSTVSLQSSRPSTCQKRASRSDIHAPVSQDGLWEGRETDADDKEISSVGLSESSSNLIVTLSSKIEEQQLELETLRKQLHNSGNIADHGDV